MTSKSRCCINNPDMFCYICGEYIIKDQRKPINDTVIRLYSIYFGIEIGNQDQMWVPHIVCKICIEHLRQWEKGTRKSLKFGVPMMWREQKNHHDDCYFCMTSLAGINKNNRSKWKYPNISSATRPIPHSETVPVPVFHLSSHMDHFEHNLGDFSEEQGERFHQDIKTMEHRYQGRWDIHMMADYCWGLMRDCPGQSHTKKSLKKNFLGV